MYGLNIDMCLREIIGIIDTHNISYAIQPSPHLSSWGRESSHSSATGVNLDKKYGDMEEEDGDEEEEEEEEERDIRGSIRKSSTRPRGSYGSSPMES